MEDIRRTHIFLRLYVRERAAARLICLQWREEIDRPEAWPAMTKEVAQRFTDQLSREGRTIAAEWLGRVFYSDVDYVSLVDIACQKGSLQEVTALVEKGEYDLNDSYMRERAFISACAHRRPDLAAAFQCPVPPNLITCHHFALPTVVHYLLDFLSNECACHILPALIVNGYYGAARVFVARGHTCSQVAGVAPNSSISDLRWVEETIGIHEQCAENLLKRACAFGNEEIIRWALKGSDLPRNYAVILCWHGHEQLFRKLVSKDRINHGLFLAACSGGNLRLAQYIFRVPFDPREGMLVAAMSGHLHIAVWLKRNKALVFGDSELYMAGCCADNQWDSAMWIYKHFSVCNVELKSAFVPTCGIGTPGQIEWFNAGHLSSHSAGLIAAAGRTDEGACPAIRILMTQYTWERAALCDAACHAYETGITEGAELIVAGLENPTLEEYTLMLHGACKGSKVAAVRQLCHYVPEVNFIGKYSEGVMLALTEHYGLLGVEYPINVINTVGALDLAECIGRLRAEAGHP